MSGRMYGLHKILGAYEKTMLVHDGDVCALCGKAATHKVETLGGGRGACTAHAVEADKRGYQVRPPILSNSDPPMEDKL